MSGTIPDLLVMDRCCFVNCIQNRDSDNVVFDHEGVKVFINETQGFHNCGLV